MPRLKEKASKRTFKLTARFTPDEEQLLLEAAKQRDLSPSGFARQVLLAATSATANERLLLAKTCKIEAMVQLLFGGLFAQLNDHQPFGKEHFKQALDLAESVQFRKAEEHLSKLSANSNGCAHG